jgi:hypothetical protein
VCSCVGVCVGVCGCVVVWVCVWRVCVCVGGGLCGECVTRMCVCVWRVCDARACTTLSLNMVNMNVILTDKRQIERAKKRRVAYRHAR